MMDKVMVGIEMARISVIFRIHSRKRQVVSIIPLHFRCNLCMIMTKYTWPIVILILIPIAQNF
jgi:hypothetical protein